MRLMGFYNEYGYNITDIDTGLDLYHAGNSPFESTDVIPSGLSLKKIKKMCNNTGKEMARENNCEWIGVEVETALV